MHVSRDATRGETRGEDVALLAAEVAADVDNGRVRVRLVDLADVEEVLAPVGDLEGGAVLMELRVRMQPFLRHGGDAVQVNLDVERKRDHACRQLTTWHEPA